MIRRCCALNGGGRDFLLILGWPVAFAIGLFLCGKGISRASLTHPGIPAPPASLPACGGALPMQNKNRHSSRAWRRFCSALAVSEGFEPPVRSHVHLFSRQAPSTTRTTHLGGCKVTILFSIRNPSGDLLEPLGEVILGIEVVHGETDPAGDEDEHDGDDLTDEGNRFLDDVENSENREDDTDDVNDGSHGLVC